jgi:hypothetical protein
VVVICGNISALAADFELLLLGRTTEGILLLVILLSTRPPLFTNAGSFLSLLEDEEEEEEEGEEEDPFSYRLSICKYFSLCFGVMAKSIDISSDGDDDCEDELSSEEGLLASADCWKLLASSVTGFSIMSAYDVALW